MSGAEVPGREAPRPAFPVDRIGPRTGQLGWAAPVGASDPAFRNAAIGFGGPIRYRFRAEASRTTIVVFGLCEGYWDRPGQRPLDLGIEGKIRRRVDPVAEKGRNVPTVYPFEARDQDADGWIDITVAPVEGAPDRNTILNVLWVFSGGEVPPPDGIASGRPARPPLARIDCGADPHSGEVRTRCRPSREIASLERTGADETVVTLDEISLDPGGSARLVISIERNGFAGDGRIEWADAEKLRDAAAAYWESLALPYDVIRVPDPRIQALLDTAVREIYQMRYVIRGLPAYFFGPSCYNDYWILDGSFIAEALAMLGRVEDAGGYADYLLLHQQEDGRIQCMNKHWKETGIALVTLYRHARLIGDREWLAARWPQVRRAVEAIGRLRRSVTDPNAPNLGLCPVGFGDGGIGEEAEYTNNHWLLAGVKAAVEAARWLGRIEEARAWDDEYRDFERAFRRAIERDAKVDARGNRYIPVVMGPATPKHPTRGQWAFCQGVYPGRIFAPDDPLMLGTLKMLEAHEVQGGIMEDSGWLSIWPQCGSFYGHDWLWLGDGVKAAKLLDAFARHASPLCNWREEMPKQTRPGEVFPWGRGGGDMPHVSASAEFIRLTGHLLAFDRGGELHLLEGLPPAWTKPGMKTTLNGLRTPFGPLGMSLTVAPDGKTASLRVDPLSDPSCRKVVVHVGGWATPDAAAVRELPPDRAHEVVLALSPRGS